MNDYMDIYLKRVNRYGEDYQTRTQGRREEDFEYLLQKSVYRIEFNYEEEEHPGVFTPFSQNETKTLHYLLTRRNLDIPTGTVLDLPIKIDNSFDIEYQKWLVYYKEEIVASGYNKYIMLRLTHEITWTARDGNNYHIWAYLYGQEDNMLRDELKSRSRVGTVYVENLKSSFFITTVNEHINKEDYFVVRRGTPLEKGYRVTGYDFDSTLGVEYVTVDPVYLRDETPAPADDGSDDFYWLRGGDSNGSS